MQHQEEEEARGVGPLLEKSGYRGLLKRVFDDYRGSGDANPSKTILSNKLNKLWKECLTLAPTMTLTPTSLP